MGFIFDLAQFIGLLYRLALQTSGSAWLRRQEGEKALKPLITYIFFFKLSQDPLFDTWACLPPKMQWGQGCSKVPRVNIKSKLTELLVQTHGFTIIKIQCWSDANHFWGWNCSHCKSASECLHYFFFFFFYTGVFLVAKNSLLHFPTWRYIWKIFTFLTYTNWFKYLLKCQSYLKS